MSKFMDNILDNRVRGRLLALTLCASTITCFVLATGAEARTTTELTRRDPSHPMLSGFGGSSLPLTTVRPAKTAYPLEISYTLPDAMPVGVPTPIRFDIKYVARERIGGSYTLLNSRSSRAYRRKLRRRSFRSVFDEKPMRVRMIGALGTTSNVIMNNVQGEGSVPIAIQSQEQLIDFTVKVRPNQTVSVTKYVTPAQCMSWPNGLAGLSAAGKRLFIYSIMSGREQEPLPWAGYPCLPAWLEFSYASGISVDGRDPSGRNFGKPERRLLFATGQGGLDLVEMNLFP